MNDSLKTKLDAVETYLTDLQDIQPANYEAFEQDKMLRRYADPTRATGSLFSTESAVAESKPAPAATAATPVQAKILKALGSPQTMDELIVVTGLSAAEVRSELTLLEIQRRIRREGSRIARAT